MGQSNQVIDDILNDIKLYYGESAYQQFYNRLVAAGFDSVVHCPLLRTNEDPHAYQWKPFHLNETSTARMTALSFQNRTSTPTTLSLGSRFSSLRTLPELFSAFISVAHHATRLAHFRDHPNIFGRMLSGNRYFLFHGDGFCTMLALLFQALAHEVLGIRIESRYCRSADNQMSHGYCTFDSGGSRLYVDPDLKNLLPDDQFPSFEPGTWFLNLIENICIRKFDTLSPQDKTQLFWDDTQAYFSWLLACCTRELSLPGSRYAVTRKLFTDTMLTQSEILDINANDYEWKPRYRAAVRAFEPLSKSLFFQRVRDPVVIELYPQDRFEVNVSTPDMARELSVLRYIFFGRVPLRWTLNMKCGETRVVQLPEFPWMIVSSSTELKLSGITISWNKSASGNLYWLGMGSLQKLNPEISAGKPITLTAPTPATVEIYFPCNASFWSSDLLRIESDGNRSIEGQILEA